MPKDRDWNPGDPVRAWWTDAVQELLSGGAFNFQLTKQSNTVVRIPVLTTNLPAGIVIPKPDGSKGLFRWRTTNLDLAHPAGGAGLYDIYVTAPTDNVITTASGIETDASDRTFSGAIRVAASVPTGVVGYRLVGQTVWDGAAIVGIVPAIPGAFLLGTAAGQALPGDHTSVTNQRTPSDATITRVKFSDPSLLPYHGDMKFSARAADHGDWLVADGRTLLRSTYAALYSAMGGAASPYGQGNGTTTFNLPDMRGRVPVGADNPGTSQGDAGRLSASETRGAAAGEEKHQLSVAELAAHLHGMGAAGSHNHSGSTSGQNNNLTHHHQTQANSASVSGIGPGWFFGNGAGGTITIDTGNQTSSLIHDHTIGTDGSHTHAGSNTGADTPHNNMQPYLVGQHFVYAPAG